MVRWTRLRKLSGEAFSEIGKRNYGRPTCIAVAGLIALGTSKGMILIFDTQQELKATIGLGTKAVESGAITAIALAADHSTVAGGHADGSIFTWEVAKPARPFLHIPPLELSKVNSSGTNGHVKDVSILHLGFLGTRHTAVVSADNKGMAFSHLASRGMGPLSRIVNTRRILGRYPEFAHATARPRKPSSVLAFAPLPLGNLESATDNMGLVAMLTPYLLVVVSTIPVAQTQHKASKPKELTAHGAMSAALAWYPAMKVADNATASGHGLAKLAYCWLNVLIILDLAVSEDNEGQGPPEIHFKPRRRWKAGESIVAMQWLSRSILAIVTITQQLLIFEDDTARVTDSSDLIKKHMYHVDSFSQQLSQLIETLDEEDTSMHGVVADAFYMSFKAYKGRLFLLCHQDVSIGALANWADRLLALMEYGDFVGAIRLATAFYTGDVDRATVGLPSTDSSRKALVREKLLEMMFASLKYGFGKNPGTTRTRVSETQLQKLAQACFVACLSLQELDFLFEEVYGWYGEGHLEPTYFDSLEPFIVSREIQTLPPEILKGLVNYFVEKGDSAALEETLCRLNPETMDIDQVTKLCKSHQLYDALFYVWTQALGDSITVMKGLLDNSHPSTGSNFNDEGADHDSQMKVFPYLSYTLTERVYPTGEILSGDKALRCKADIYHFFFSGRSYSDEHQVSFPYLRAALYLSTSSFMSMLNEAFEDSFLNGAPEQANGTLASASLSDEQRFALSLNRQYILTILLEILVAPDYDAEDIIYLDMFIARSLPKFPQFLLLSGSIMHRVFVELCNCPNDDLADDCQLSVEYLLSVYQPPDLHSLMPLLMEAQFYRVVKSVYRTEKQFGLLLKTCFVDSDHPDDIFQCIANSLRPDSGLSQRQVSEVRDVILENLSPLTASGVSTAARTIDQFAPDLHQTIVRHLDSNEYEQYQYLREVLVGEHRSQRKVERGDPGSESFVELYIRLLCDFDRDHVSDYVDGLESGDLRLSEVLPSLEGSGVIDAAVVLIARKGKIRDAMDRLVKHLRTLEVALTSLLQRLEEAPDAGNSDEAANDFVDSLEKYVRVGIWLCRGQTQLPSAQRFSHKAKDPKTPRKGQGVEVTEDELQLFETLWLDLVDAAVQVTRSADEALSEPPALEADSEAEKTPTQAHPHTSQPFDAIRLQTRLRNVVQEAFTALLAATTTRTGASSAASRPAPAGHPSFLRILRAFLARAANASPSLAHLRRVLGSIFGAYAYEEGLLSLANRLLEKDLFERVEAVAEQRKRGWRPLGQVCGGCGARVWGPGVGNGVWEAWLTNNERRGRDLAKGAGMDRFEDTKGKGKGKGRATEPHAQQLQQGNVGAGVLIFSCRHLFHRRCLEEMADKQASAKSGATEGGPLEGQADLPAYTCPLELDNDVEST